MSPTDSHAGSAHDRPEALGLAGATAVAVADALDRLAELPSTPRLLAAETQIIAGELSQSIATAGRHAVEVEVAPSCVVSAAGILALVGAMPSTPPAVAADAASWSQKLWELLDESARPPVGD